MFASRFAVQRKGKAMADSGFEKEFVDAHNKYRKMHGAPPLSLSRDLCNSAQKWADHLMSIRTLQHSSTNHGENLFYSYSSAPKKLDGNDAVNSWYSEIKDYGFDKPGFSSGTGHFTQVVWKESQELGVGLATDGNTVFVVGQYHPAGNMCNAGYFERNVLPADKDRRTADWKGDRPSRPLYRPHMKPSGAGDTERDRKADSQPTTHPDQAKFQRDFLRACNERRTAHGAPSLMMSSTLNDGAQAWAETLLSDRVLKNSKLGHGENIWAKTGPVGTTATGQEVVEAWYKQEENYDFSKPGHQDKTGQFTQLVWRGSKEVGVGRASGSGMVIVVAHFHPAGNITNPKYHTQNVLPRGSKVTDEPVEDVSAKMGALAVGSGDTLPANELDQFSCSLLMSLNQYRSQHGAWPLSISPSLSKEAQNWATHLVSMNTLMNSNNGYGESIFSRSGSSTSPPSGSDVADSWYKGIEKYDFSFPGFQNGAGNFTQLVWKSSKEVGFGLATNGRGTFIAVAFYTPGGNITNPGYFQDNVKAKGSFR